MNRRFVILGGAAAAVLQTGAIANMVNDHVQMVQTGTEVILATGFVDPRDFFRGHYVTLNLRISRIPKSSVEVIGDIEQYFYGSVYVSLGAKDADGFAVPDKIYRDLPANPQAPILRADYISLMGDDYRLHFSFDRYFAPKLRAEELEKLRRERRLGVIMSVQPDGTGIITGVTIDGERIYDEPLF